jgi:hypothetical protein
LHAKHVSDGLHASGTLPEHVITKTFSFFLFKENLQPVFRMASSGLVTQYTGHVNLLGHVIVYKK